MPDADSRFVGAELTPSPDRSGASPTSSYPPVAVRDADNIPECPYRIIEENARRFLAGEELTNVVDKRRWY